MSPRVLVAGIGNIFLGDDAFGVHVARRLLRRRRPAEVRVQDFGIRGLDLAYALLDGCDTAILIDAVPRGEAPGTLFVLEPEIADSPASTAFEAHSMDPVKVLNLARSMGAVVRRILVVGCEPTPIDPEQDIQMDLSSPVAAAVAPAVELVESLVAKAVDRTPLAEVTHAHEIIASDACTSARGA